ncbi:UNVERIFIED_CONTAM: hypothetical protein HDU68_009432 [Siphonaria sp. JEL0065]|nr:hypothetical protein HDU68_009432 [Siphonaria sp. JEL0065]
MGQHVETLIQLMKDIHVSLDGAADPEAATQIAVNTLHNNHQLIETAHEMDVLCEHIVRHPQFDHGCDDTLAELLFMLKGILLDLIDNLELGHVILSLVYHLGTVYGANVFRKIGQDMDSMLVPIVARHSLHRIHFPAVKILYEVCQLQELSLSELNEFTSELIVVLFDVVERTSQADQLEEYNYACIRLLLAFNHQFLMKNHARNVIENRIITQLSPRLHLGKSLGANIIFMFNRADNSRVQRLIIRFLYISLKTPETSALFYTNDLKVILDVVLRELRAVADENEEMQQGYLNLLPPLLHNPQLQNHKIEDVSCLLGELRRQDSGRTGGSESPNRSDLPSTPLSSVLGNSNVRPSTRRVAERVFLECRDILVKRS